MWQTETITIYKKTIPIVWDAEIKPGEELRVYTSELKVAAAAVELLLDRKGYVQYWYDPDAPFKAKSWHIKIVAAPPGCWQDWAREKARERAVGPFMGSGGRKNGPGLQ